MTVVLLLSISSYLACLCRPKRRYLCLQVVVFNMQTLHGSTTNETEDQLRLSCDLRFQRVSESRDERWMGPVERLGYRVATYDMRNNLPGAISMHEAKLRWGLAGAEGEANTNEDSRNGEGNGSKL